MPFFNKNVGGLFLSCISPVHMGPWAVRGRYQAVQGVSRHSTRMDSRPTDKSCGGTEIRTHDIAALAPMAAIGIWHFATNAPPTHSKQ
jgi:hypothetical protein